MRRKFTLILTAAACMAGVARAATYRWIQGGDPLQWEAADNWQGGTVIPKTEINADLVFGSATSGQIGENPDSARVTFGSVTWETSFEWRSFGSYSVPGCITVDTGGGLNTDATATFLNGSNLTAYYVSWQLNSNLVLSGTGGNGTLVVRAANNNGVAGPGGFIVESGKLSFGNTHLSENYTYTGGVTVKSGGTVEVGSAMGALGDGQLAIDEGGVVQAHNSAFDQDVRFDINSAGANPPQNTTFITGGGTSWNASGTWTFDLTDAGTNVGSSWTIIGIGATATYNQAGFSVAGFTESSPGMWTGAANGANYQFAEATGILSVVPSTGPDTTQPSLLSLTPADEATGVLREVDLVAKFDEPITLKNGGTITITDLSDGSSTVLITLADPRVSSPKGNDLVIDLDGNLQSNTNYSVRISGDAIEDRSATPNVFDGISDDVTWTFVTEPPDFDPPVITTLSPADDATKVLPWANLTASFDEPISLTGSGTITLTDLDDGSGTQTITLPDSRVTSPNGDDLLIDLVASLEFGTNYSVGISADAVEDQADTPNGFAGILDDDTWEFTTKAGAAQIHNVLLVTIELADALPNKSIGFAENKMFNDKINIDDAFREASYGQMGLHLGDNSGKDPTVAFRYLDTTKAQAGSPAALRDRARADLTAMGYNMSQSNYRFVIYIVPGGFNNNAGTAALGGQWSIYQSFSEGVIMHEMGHCLGGNHSGQDPGCALGWATWNFAAEKKIRFGWMDAFPGTVTDVAANTSFTLVPLSRSPATLPGLRVARVAGSGDDVFHISYRVSEDPYSRLSDPAAYSREVFVSLDEGGTLTSHKATLAAGESYTRGDMIVTCNSVAADGLSADVSIGFNTYATWIDDFALDSGDRDPADDPDGDSIANGLEAWFGTHPGRFDAGLANLATDGTTATFTHPQNAAPPSDLTGYYEWSPNLFDWYAGNGVDGPPGGPTVTISSATIGTTTTVTVTASVALDRIFLRAGVRP